VRVVVDASVAVQWILPDQAVEPDADRAVELLAAIRDGSAEPLQPAHWLLETVAVVTRLRPEVAEEALTLLAALELPVATDLEILRRSTRLATALSHDLFDTLYHSVALERDAVLVTADDRYAAMTRDLGALVRLADWRSEPGSAAAIR
jgi:predicted nucleic acid-binding protein